MAPEAPAIHIFLASNNVYVQHLCVTIASAVKTSSVPLRFHILHNDITEQSKAFIESLLHPGRDSIKFNKIEKTLFKDFKFDLAHITIEAAFRFLIGDLEPALKKALYLDCDLIVRRDLAELWNIDLGDKYAGVVEDLLRMKNPRHREAFEYGSYFNSGVILLNLDRIRRDFDFAAFLSIEEKNRDWFRYKDQDVLNMAFKNNVLYLPLRWNVSSAFLRKTPKGLRRSDDEVRDAQLNPAIVHYTGPDKPWIIPYGIASHPYANEYFEYLAQTPFAGQAAIIRKKFPAFKCFLSFWWRHPGFFLRPSYWRNRLR